ncbi:CPBP family intramembrane glutamic endopeptidase [Natronospora cellulosivora (SeqCode)]
MKKTNLKISLFLGFIAFISGFFVVPYQMEVISEELVEEILESIPFSMNVLTLVSSLQLFVIAFVLSFLGLKLARKTSFSIKILDAIFEKRKVHVDRKSLLTSIISGVVLGLIIIGSDRFYFQNLISMLAENPPEFSVLALLAGIFYGGVVEEILLRLFLMSLIVWICMKIFKFDKDNIFKGVYWMAIILTSVIFAAGHLPVTEMMFGELTSPLLLRAFLLNGIGGLIFGYLYWKKGFEYAVISHAFAHISMQLLFIPMFF